MNSPKNIVALYGIGNFGFALLRHLDTHAGKQSHIQAYDRNTELRKHLRVRRKHIFLHPDISVSKSVHIVEHPKDFFPHATVLILAVTSDAIREVVRGIRPYIKKRIIIVNTAKALERTSGKTMSQVIAEELRGIPYTYAMLAGGTIAKDLFAHEPLGIDIASVSSAVQKKLTVLFASSRLRVYPTDDVVGVEYASAMKNVIAILAGMMSGMGFSYGAETHLISRAANEVEQFILSRGGKTKTFRMRSQCWGNDLWMSCTGDTRNRAFGILLGKGYTLSHALRTMQRQHKTVEGINTLVVLKTMNGIHRYPLLSALIDFTTKKCTRRQLINIMIHNANI